jgi:hypothetical protein
MKDLIIRILKEETSPDNIRKGIDISVKMLKKQFPFVVGWEYANDPEDFDYNININLEIDHMKMMEFYDLEPHPRWHKYLKDDIISRVKYPYSFSLTNYEDKEFNKIENDEELENTLKDIYDFIDEKFKMELSRKNILFNFKQTKILQVISYIYV